MHKLSLAFLQRSEQISLRLSFLDQYFFKEIKAFIFQLISVRINLIFALKRLFKDVLFEDTSSFDIIREHHDTHAVLDTLIPDAHISALICPLHHTVPVALVLQVIAFVPVTRLPFEDTISVLLVILVETLVRIALRVTELVSLLFLPFSMAVFESIQELASVAAAILPLVLAEAFRLSLGILANITVAIGEKV